LGDPQKHASFAPDAVERIPDWALYAFLGLVSVLIFGQSIGFPLIWDSASLISQNPATRIFDPIAAFTTRTTIGPDTVEGGRVGQIFYYRPVLRLVLSAWYQVAGESAALWHGLAVAVNIVAVVLVFRLMRAMDQPPWVAFAIALLFAVNPGRVSGVVSVYGLSNQIFGVFVLAAFLCWVREARWWTLAFLGLALGSRETAILFPVIALIWELLFKRDRPAWRWLGAQVALVVLYLTVRHLIVGPAGLTTFSPLVWLNTVVVIISGHLHSLAWPGWGARIYPLEDFSEISLRVALSYAVLLAGTAALVWGLRRDRWIAFWLLWFGVWLSIHFNVGHFGDFLMAEKDNYLLAVSFAVALVSATKPAGRYALVLLVTIAVAQGGLSAWRASHWRDPVTFFTSAAQHAPRFTSVHYNLGLAHVDAQDFASAEAAFRRTVELSPGHSMAWNNLGNIRYAEKDFAGALQAWQRAFDADDGNMMAAYNLSLAYSRLGDKQTAARYYARFLELRSRQAPPPSGQDGG
jgi:hypothetical protein